MEHAKKMVLIPSELINRVSQHQRQNPQFLQSINNNNNNNNNNISEQKEPSFLSNPYTPLSELDTEMSKILCDDKLSAYEKWKSYSQLLQKYLYHVESNRKPVEVPIVEPEKSEIDDLLPVEQILASIPSTLKGKTAALLNWLKRRGTITWNRDGYVFINGQKINNSNIIDYLGDLARERKTSIEPPGMPVFLKELKKLNVPRELVGNRERFSQMLFQNNTFTNINPQPSTSSATTPVSTKNTRKKWLKF